MDFTKKDLEYLIQLAEKQKEKEEEIAKSDEEDTRQIGEVFDIDELDIVLNELKELAEAGQDDLSQETYMTLHDLVTFRTWEKIPVTEMDGLRHLQEVIELCLP